jgi:hypothetical protein
MKTKYVLLSANLRIVNVQMPIKGIDIDRNRDRQHREREKIAYQIKEV